jgi:(p)ppGpp synthase/HD superfamily hydrolase
MRWNQELFKKALDFAAKAHGAQLIPGSGLPYVVHVIKVASEVLTLSEPCDLDLAFTCALLHDTVEDAGITVEMIEQGFGAAVAAGVSALTKNEALPKDERMADSLARIAAQPREVAMVKLADRITNLEPPPAKWSAQKRQTYHAEAKVILARLGAASPELSARFEQKLKDYLPFLEP